MILLKQPIDSIIYAFAENAVSFLASNNLSGFIDEFDYSCLKNSDLYIALRYGNERNKAILIDNPLIIPCYSAQNTIIETQYGYLLYYELFSYGRKNNILLEICFIIDKDMLYTILEDIKF